jgi:hypothetical protein
MRPPNGAYVPVVAGPHHGHWNRRCEGAPDRADAQPVQTPSQWTGGHGLPCRRGGAAPSTSRLVRSHRRGSLAMAEESVHSDASTRQGAESLPAPSHAAALVTACGLAGALAVPLHPVNTLLSAAIFTLVAFAGGRLWRASGLRTARPLLAGGGCARAQRGRRTRLRIRLRYAPWPCGRMQAPTAQFSS